MEGIYTNTSFARVIVYVPVGLGGRAGLPVGLGGRAVLPVRLGGRAGLPVVLGGGGGFPLGLGGRDGLPADSGPGGGGPGGIPAGLTPAWFAMMKAVSVSPAWKTVPTEPLKWQSPLLYVTAAQATVPEKVIQLSTQVARSAPGDVEMSTTKLSILQPTT